jgi:hypothetical protein
MEIADMVVTPFETKPALEKVPSALVYEVAQGKPIYYRGYREVINGNLTLEAIMADSSLQAWLKTQISFLLLSQLSGKNYEVLAGELGLLLGGGDYRGADISIYRSENFVLDNHYSSLPPEAIVEIDTQIDPQEENELDYVQEKLDDYLRFGVKQVVWVFTRTRKVMIAVPDSPWLMVGWNSDIRMLEGICFNLEKMLEGKKIG